LNRVSQAFRAFFALLFGGKLPDDLTAELGLSARPLKPTAAKPAPVVPKPSAADGALQLLGILQRDGRMLDFFLEDVAPYSDEQVGNAVRGVHTPVKETLERFFKFAPVIDGVEGTSVQTPGKDPALVKFIGNVPATPPSGGVLRHRGWQVTQVDFPAFPAAQNLKLIAPAELEIE
jgi:hypothetical protein